jgi:hypothetical protein
MTPLDKAWSLLKELQPAFQDATDAQEMRHQQNMQNMLDIYTPRGNTNPQWLQPAFQKPLTPFPQGFVNLNPWMEAANLEHQARTSRNPADARMFQQEAEEARVRNAPTMSEESQPSASSNPEQGIDLAEMERFLAEAYRRSVAPLSYRRKVKPFSDQEMNRQLNEIKRFRNRRGFQ